LLRHFAIRTPMLSLHEHNERQRVGLLLERLQQGENIALISDAGTPLVSDPGYLLVHAVLEAGIRVVPIPGPSAAIAALSAAGLPSDRFAFEGFLPARGGARRARLAELKTEPRTLIFYESPHRIVACLEDLLTEMGAERSATVARELTKQFETIRTDSLQGLLEWVLADPDQQRGDFVILLAGASVDQDRATEREGQRVLAILLENMPLKQAVTLAARITGARKNALYQFGLSLQDR
jgi:16S rRNA (cytidine1402-2'-O)-methyltransferase